MKKTISCIVSLFIFFIAKPQKTACSAICSQNLANPVYATVLTSLPISYATDKATPDYHDVSYIQDGDAPLSFCFKHATNCDTEKNALVYKVFYPDSVDYKNCVLPCVIVTHGGFFSDCSEYSLVFGLCQQLAKRGFVVFNVEYRRGSVIAPNTKYTSVQQMLGLYRACQDIRGAIRSIIKRAANENMYNDPWRIDTNSIFLTGESAGAVAILNAAYYSQEMTYQLFPKVNGSVSITEALGPLDEEFYYGEPSIDYLSHIKGICSQSSALYIPYNFRSNPAKFFPENTPKTPAILFHGNQDSIFPINYNPVYFCATQKQPDLKIDLNSESFCLNAAPFKLDPIAGTPDLITAGALGMYNYFLKPLNINSEIYIDCQMEHNLDNNGKNFRSDFGTGLTKHEDVVNYQAARIATFFQSILGGVVGNLNKRVFVECENLRTGCDPKDNYSAGGCTNCNANDGGKCDTARAQTQLISIR